jgi:hypothetical protein
MRLTGALLAVSCFALAGCQTRPDPPSAVEVKVAVPVPCAVPEPQCSTPAYDAAKKEQPADQKAKLLRAEAISQEDCLRRYREALAACR